LDDISYDGVELIRQIVDIYGTYGFETEVLAASIRHTMHLIQCAEAGADVATCPLQVITGLLKHPLTDSGLAQFLKDFEKTRI
jgi:transaldolase